MIRGNGRTESEQGVAAIFVVMTLMTVLALISIGFSRLMNREVRQSLDRQLSVAAYYAAESGVNDARSYINDGGAKIDGCDPPNDPHFVSSTVSGVTTPGDISGDGLFKYSCVIVNPTPKEIKLTIAPGQSQVIKLSGATLNSLSRLYFSWQNSAGYDGLGPQPLGSYRQMPQQTTVGKDATGLLRVGIYPLVNGCNDAALYNRYASALGSNTADANIECASRSYFMDPVSGGGTPDCSYANLSASKGCVRYNSGGDNGGTVPANCVSPWQTPDTSYKSQASQDYCYALVSNLLPVTGSAGLNNAAAYYLRLTAEYKEITVHIQATDNSAPTPNTLAISGAEAVIDVTATGNDVLRRIQVNAPLQNLSPPVDFGLQSMESICKLFRNDVPAAGIYNNPHLDAAAGAYNTDDKGGVNGINCDQPTGSNEIDPGGLPPVNVEPPPTINFTADSYNFTSGGSTTLRWSASSDADSCSGTGFNTGGSTSGSAGTGSLGAGTYTYRITCTGPGGSASQNVTITVTNPVLPPPQSCSGSATNSNGVASASGGCDRGGWSWSFSYTWSSACGVESGSGSGNSVNFSGLSGTFNVTFYLTGDSGGSWSGGTSWSRAGGGC